MARKRMFDKGLLETDAFMDMPMPTKALYFLLGMEADDEGFVSPKRVMRLYGGNDDDLKVLIAKSFVIQFESGVIVITDWHENNYLDKNKVVETKYQAEKQLLTLSSNKYHKLNQSLTKVKKKLTQYRIEENSIVENRIEEKSKISELSSQVQKVMEIFSRINPTLNWGNKTSRGSAEYLIKKFGLEGTLKMAEQAISIQGKQYAPTATTPTQLKDKLAQFKIYFDREKNNSPEMLKI